MKRLYIATDMKISGESTRKNGVIRRIRNFFTWDNAVMILNKLPMGVCSCKNKRDAQLYIAVLCIVLGCCVLPLIFVGFGLIYKR